jgi:tetratricopeptide (TPR) repeat protein
MVFGREFSEKLTHLMVATAICCATASATIIPAPTAIGLVEALLGGAALANFVLDRRYAKADALVRRCARQMESGSDAWLEAEFRDDPDAGIRRDDAIAAIQEVVPLIVPKPKELVSARLNKDRVAAFYLDRAATVRPGMFGDNADNTIAQRLFRSVVANAYRLIVTQPEFAAEVLHYSLAELLTGQDEILQGQEAEAARAEARHAEVMAGQEALLSRLVKAVGRADSGGLERETIIKIARRRRPDELLDFNRAVIELKWAVEIALDVIATGERGTNYDVFVDLVLAKVAEKTKLGDFDGGAQAVDEALIDLGRKEAEQLDIFRQSRVALLEAGVDQDILRRDASAVARRIEGIVAVENPDGRPAWSPAFRERYNRFYEEGGTKGINFSLSVAIELARRMAASARDDGERGMAGNLLGNALRALGVWERGTERLQGAISAYQLALQGRTRELAPLDWAETQDNLGTALRRLGEREVGRERYEQAVAAFREALKERTRELVPQLWAATQHNLGTALRRLGEREAGAKHLEESIAAYQLALEERTRERVPFDWVFTQYHLGNSLRILGVRQSGTTLLHQAIEAYRLAAEKCERDSAPRYWASIWMNLGSALTELGERESRTAHLEEAVAAHCAALNVFTRDETPLDWADVHTGSVARFADSGSGRAGQRGWKRRRRPCALRLRSGPASDCHFIGQGPRITLAACSGRWGSGRAGRRGWRRRWRPTVRRSRRGRASGCRCIGRRRRTTSATR